MSRRKTRLDDPLARSGTAAQRERIRRLYSARDEGMLAARDFQKQVTQAIVDLFRALAEERLDPGEAIRVEHHVVLAHLKLTQSILKETDQECISLFATDRRLLRVSAIHSQTRPMSADAQDHLTVDELPLSAVRAVKLVREVRLGEAAAGLIIAGLALLFRELLQITGTLLVLIGLLGVLHGLLLPTRWFEISVAEAADRPRFRILTPRKRSGRAMVAFLRKQIA